MTNTSKQAVSTNRRGKDFHRRYLALCRAKNFQPLAELTGICGGGAGGRKAKGNQQLATVEFFGDRFKETDWQLIIDALLEDTSLELVAIRLRKVLSDVLENGCHRIDVAIDRPVILTKRLFSRLVDSLAQFLVNNQVVRVFILEALPIQGMHMATLVNGLQQNCSITELSLARSAIRDDGCEAICSAVMHLPKIESLNLSACQLTARGCRAVAELVKFQKIQRFAQSWQYSLRYGEINHAKMQGLRHLLLNTNLCIGDEGLQDLTEVLKDDEWIRQVHFRNCGLTDKGAKFLLDCLNINKTIEKFDIRGNTGISNEACHEILIKLGVELESSDSSQSLKDVGMVGQPRMKPSEQIKCLQQQLTTERHRCSQLQLMVEQLHFQQSEYAVQLSKLRQDYNQLVNERDELLMRAQRSEKPRPRSRKTNIRKSKSDALPSVLFSRTGTASQYSGRKEGGTKSEMTLRWLRDPQAAPASAASKRSQVLERSIGDSHLNAQLSDIAELNEELNAVQKVFSEGGFGDMGVGCSKVRVRKLGYINEGDCSGRTEAREETSEDEYFKDIQEAADHRIVIDQANHEDVSSYDEDEEDDDLDESANSVSGADLLKMIVKKRSAEHSNDGQSIFMSVYSGDEN